MTKLGWVVLVFTPSLRRFFYSVRVIKAARSEGGKQSGFATSSGLLGAPAACRPACP